MPVGVRPVILLLCFLILVVTPPAHFPCNMQHAAYKPVFIRSSFFFFWGPPTGPIFLSQLFGLPQEEGTALFMEKRFKEATERYIAAADSASAVPEKTDPGGEEEQAAVALEVRTVLVLHGGTNVNVNLHTR